MMTSESNFMKSVQAKGMEAALKRGVGGGAQGKAAAGQGKD